LKSVKKLVEEVSKRHKLAVYPDAYIWQLSVGEQQRVELIKALCLGANLLVLDEPTAALTPQETDELIYLLRDMVKKDFSIIFISHKLNEVMAVSDRVEVLRNGRVVYSANTSETSSYELAKEMAGREINLPVSKSKSNYGNIVLDINDVWAYSDRGSFALQGINIEVKAGEIMGIAGKGRDYLRR